jgi:hypothetical protein
MQYLKRTPRALSLTFLLFFVLLISGCGGTRTGIVQGEKWDSIAAIPKSIGSSKFAHRSNLGNRALVSLICIPCSFAVNTRTVSQTAELDNKCLDAINNVLSSKGNEATTSKIAVDVNYEVVVGLLKNVALKIDWYVDNDVKTKNIHIKTIVVSDDAFDMFPSTTDEKYKAIFVDLAEKSTHDFLSILVGEKPRYSVDSVELAY